MKRQILCVLACLALTGGTGFATELLLNGDFEIWLDPEGLEHWTEGGDGLNHDYAGLSDTSCSGDHGEHSPGVNTFWFSPGLGRPAVATLTQVADTPDAGRYVARICVAGTAFAGGDTPPTDPEANSARLDLEFFDEPAGAGSSLGTQTSGDVSTDAGEGIEKSITLLGYFPSGTQSVSFTITLTTGLGVGWGDPNEDQYAAICHLASFNGIVMSAVDQEWELYR